MQPQKAAREDIGDCSDSDSILRTEKSHKELPGARKLRRAFSRAFYWSTLVLTRLILDW